MITSTHVPGQQYSLEQISFVVQELILNARTGFRGASRVVDSVARMFGLNWEVPHYTTCRAWLLRIGLFQLRRPKDMADDCFWIVDHTVQIGQEKCLVILGLRLRDMPAAGTALSLADLQLLNLLPVTHSDKQVVHDQLESTAKITGVPRAILGDHGGDLHGGVTLFCESHPETTSLYDMTHKAATLLKARLNKDIRWISFCSQAGQTKVKVQQTELAFLMPPSQRSKARYMNLASLLRWGKAILSVLDRQPENVLRHGTAERLEEKYGWLRAFRNDLALWSEYQTLLENSVDEIRRHGYSQSSGYRVALRVQPHLQTVAGCELKDQLLTFIADETASLAAGERLPGSSEPLESSLGKLKSFEGDFDKSGFTSLLPAFGALVGRLTPETIYEALVSVPGKNVQHWITQHLGQTFLSKRRLALQN